MSAANPHLILPVGTQVVVQTEVRGTDGKPVHPRGAVGVIIAAPSDYWHSYRVRFPDGFEAMFRRQELAVLAHYKDGAVGAGAEPLREYDLFDFVIYRCIVGSRAYGLSTDESDTDRRGVYLPPAELHWSPVQELLGLEPARETIESSCVRDGDEIDLVTHDAKKFFLLMLKKNGYVLEQLYSPLVVHTTPEHEELKSIGRSCMTRHHAHHYMGFADTQWKLFEKDRPRRVKPLLYVYRVLLTGIHLMQTGEVEANLLRLNERFRLTYIDDLVARKLAGPEKATLPDDDIEFHRNEYRRLLQQLEGAHQQSKLPEAASARHDLHGLLLRLRRAN